jgi:hypothetical protein
MQKQKDMEEAMLKAHREFVQSMGESLGIIDQELKNAKELAQICTDEWCHTTESFIDEIHKQVYSISEPRFASADDSEKIKNLRTRVKDMYVNFKGISSGNS